MSFQINALSQKTLNPLVKTCKYFSLTGKRNLIQNLKTNYSLNLNLNTPGNNIINNNGFKLQKLTYHQLSKENAVFFIYFIIICIMIKF